MYEDSLYREKKVEIPSYIFYRNSYTGKMTSLYWDGAREYRYIYFIFFILVPACDPATTYLDVLYLVDDGCINFVQIIFLCD